jgi:pimeloyl-ACP methyl ester carboxylesterase
MPYVTAADGAQIFYKEWGEGRPVVLSHGWPLSSDSWEAQQLFLAENGFRVIAHDRRGHGRSTQTWGGNEMDTYADDLATVIDALDLGDVTLIGFSTGGGEVARYVGRHGTARVAQVVLVSAVPPFMLQTADNPGGVPMARPSPVGRATRSGGRARRPATATRTSASLRSRPPTSARTWTRSTSRRWSSTATTTRSSRSRWAARRRRSESRTRASSSIPGHHTASPTPTSSSSPTTCSRS